MEVRTQMPYIVQDLVRFELYASTLSPTWVQSIYINRRSRSGETQTLHFNFYFAYTMIHSQTPSPCLVLSLFILVCSSALAITNRNETEIDRHALLCVKSLLSDPDHALSSWTNTSLYFCNWHGVRCSVQSAHRATGLDLSSKGLTGSIAPCIGNLTSLRSLILSNNSFHDSIPPELGLLTELSYLNLSMNSLSGVIPSELSSCTQLQVLGLWNNSLQGEIPPSLSQCKNIQEINLSNNKLQGSIPAAFGMNLKLEILILAGNSLSGDIPPSLGGSSLIHVDLGSNSLTGGIPEYLVNGSIQVLRLKSNRLTGNLPEALFNSSSLTTISLQGNFLIGSVPQNTAISPPLIYLNLRENKLSGPIPHSLGNLSSLVYLNLGMNNLVWTIPESLSRILTLQKIRLNNNNLSGHVPLSLFNMSSMILLSLGNNIMNGRIPSNIAYTLPKIESLILTSNRFEGTIPTSLQNASHLEDLYIAENMVTGFIPFFGSLSNLVNLDVGGNMLQAGDWAFLSSLSNCTELKTLMLDSNNLHGNFPASIGNLPNSLERLWLKDSQISGPIPSEIGNLKNLTEFLMGYNILSGIIPPTVAHLHNMVVLGIAHNKLSGQIPDTIGRLSHLNTLYLEENNLSGSIPVSIGHCRQLQILNLSHNSLVGSIPSDLLQISSLSIYLDLSYNYLSGQIPEEVGNLININTLRMSNNQLSSNIPSTLGQCVLLEFLEIQGNYLEGNIPQTFINLVGLHEMDLSRNNLSGAIPGFLASFSNLHILNLSFNNFEGVVPMGGIFSNGRAVSLQGNGRMCASTVPASGLPLCTEWVHMKRKNYFIPKIVLPICFFGVVVTLSCFVIILKRKKEQPSVLELKEYDQGMKRITFQDIKTGTNEFSSDNLIGSGSFGTVYKCCLELEDNIVAIKIFNLDKFGANESFIAECETLRNIKHRNLVDVKTLCSSLDLTGKEFKALVFKYMPNGNLDMWLHQEVHESARRMNLSLGQRISIALDVAFALDYLHNQCACPLIHCDLKPSNVLLDFDMTACVGDFGLARFLSTTANESHTCSESLSFLRGSFGYIPPEYATNVKISTKGDVYSFGVLLLEMITGTRPTDEMLNISGTTLHEYVNNKFPSNTHEILDPVLQDETSKAAEVMENCIIPLVRVGLSCSLTSPKSRWEMGKVCTQMLVIKDAFSSIHSSSSISIH
ncbi:unnamed protein product [Urochloa decumbens]|uniref:Receptor kinase-like protein Xa21 n=1 Tax=Urochloa decumbens TaxID=240449 RepID=A0ABC9AZ16_9POAL